MNNLLLANLAYLLWENKKIFRKTRRAYAACVSYTGAGSIATSFYFKFLGIRWTRSVASIIATGSFVEKIPRKYIARALELANGYEEMSGSAKRYSRIRNLPPNILVPIARV